MHCVRQCGIQYFVYCMESIWLRSPFPSGALRPSVAERCVRSVRSMHDPFKTACGDPVTLGPVASITLEKKYLVHQQGLSGADFKTLGPMATGDGKQPPFRAAHGAPP